MRRSLSVSAHRLYMPHASPSMLYHDALAWLLMYSAPSQNVAMPVPILATDFMRGLQAGVCTAPSMVVGAGARSWLLEQYTYRKGVLRSRCSGHTSTSEGGRGVCLAKSLRV